MTRLCMRVCAVALGADGPRRDPFEGPRAPVAAVREPKPCAKGPCRYSLDELHLVGIVFDGPRSVVMFESPGGVGYTLRRGDEVGTRSGRIDAIDRSCVRVREYFQTAQGSYAPNDIQVCIASQRADDDNLMKER